MSSSGREDGDCPNPSGLGQACGRVSGLMGEIAAAMQDFKMRFWNLRLRVNYYYPPDDGLAAANWKKLLHDCHADSSTKLFYIFFSELFQNHL